MDGKGYGNPDRVPFWLGLYLLCPDQFFADLVHLPTAPAQLCGISCKYIPLTALFVISFFYLAYFIYLDVFYCQFL